MLTYQCKKCGYMFDWKGTALVKCPWCKDDDIIEIKSGAETVCETVQAIIEEDVNQLAEDHWRYIRDLLDQFCEAELWEYKEAFRFTYISAFKHGYKHGFNESVKEDK